MNVNELMMTLGECGDPHREPIEHTVPGCECVCHRVGEVTSTLGDMLELFGPSPEEEVEQRDEDFWEGSYKGKPSHEYTDYWRTIDAARAVIGEAIPSTQEPHSRRSANANLSSSSSPHTPPETP